MPPVTPIAGNFAATVFTLPMLLALLLWGVICDAVAWR